MAKLKTSWFSPRLGQDVSVTRWGDFGAPVLFFPTAAADAEEVERFLMVQSLAPLIDGGRIKLYSVDSVAGKALLSGESPAEIGRVQSRYDAFVVHELVPAIRLDCQTPDLELVATGPSIGAFNALSMICRHPDLFRLAICMSGTYDITKWMNHEVPSDHYFASPLHFLPGLGEGEQLARLRQRFVLLTHGTGRAEDPQQSWRVADALGRKGVPNRVDTWEGWAHDWPTWREMLPKYLGELV